ncbi:MAG: hemolysin family protein [Chloroflexota bacterium]
MMFLVTLAIIALMIFFNALYVAAEFSTVSARRTKISQMAGQGNRIAGLLLPTLEDPHKLDRYVAGCQIGITISSLVLGAYAQNAIAADLAVPIASLLSSIGLASDASVALTLARSISIFGVLIFVTGLQVIFGELFPKSLAIQYPEGIALGVYWPMRISLILFALPIWLFNGSANLILKILGRSGEDNGARIHSAEEIELLVTESHEGGLLDDNERRLLRNALRLRDLTARQVMVHRTKVDAVPEGTSPEELIKQAIEAGHSRIPVYRETIDEIIGFVHIKDVFRLFVEGSEDISTVMREALFVPETLPVTDVWDQLNTKGMYLAIVFDEFGGTAGLLTQEDLIEEIFGELQDEFDDEMAVIARDKSGRIYLRGDLLVTDVNEYLELELPTESADTLSGLVFSSLGRPPVEGDEVTFGDVVIRVERMEDLSVGEVSLQLPPSEEDAPFSEWEIAEHD